MNLQDIKNEIHYLMTKTRPLSNDDTARLKNLFIEEYRLEKGIVTYHYDKELSIAELQLAAKTIYAQLKQTPYRNNLSQIDCPAPIEVGEDWKNFKVPTYYNPYSSCFYIETPNFGSCHYSLSDIPQILELDSSLFLKSAQDTFRKIYTTENVCDIDDANNLVYSFILINSSITNYFLRIAQELDIFSWTAKYSPCFFDRNRILNFKGWMSPVMLREIDTHLLNIGKRYLIRDFAMQLKYLTFWVGLMDTYTFPNLQDNFHEVYAILVFYLLSNYANIYIYDVVSECKPVSKSDESDSRGSESNTTRLKIFFTNADDKPRLIRLDLPHKDHPYVHLNIEEFGSSENIHYRLSKDESSPGEYDNVFTSLVEALRVNNYYSLSTRHSPVSDDRMVFREMEYWTAMYNFAVPAIGYSLIGNNESINHIPEVNTARDKLLILLEEDGIPIKEAMQLNDAELFEFADKSIRKNALIP